MWAYSITSTSTRGISLTHLNVDGGQESPEKWVEDGGVAQAGVEGSVAHVEHGILE